jgi:hypothetical protein
MPSKSTILLAVIIGFILSIASPMIGAIIPRDTFLHQVYLGIHWPESFLLDKLTDWLSPGNRDQGMLYYMIVHPLYWFAVAMSAAWVWERRRKARA